MDQGADVNGLYEDGNSTTVLSCAIRFGNLEIVKFLIGEGADVNKIKKSGESELECAISTDKIEMVKCLLEHGADVHRGKQYPLTKAAIENKNIEMVKLLLKHKADINGGMDNNPLFTATGAKNIEMVQFLLEQGAWKNDSLLSLSVRYKNTEMVKLFLDHGCDPNCTFMLWKPILIFAVRNWDEKIAELLLDYGARMDKVTGEYEISYLHEAIYRR